MSDPYSPYQPPSPYQPGYPGGYAPAPYGQPAPAGLPGVVRAAAVMLAVIGGLILIGSVLLAVGLLMVPIDELRSSGALADIPPEMDPQTLLQFAAGCIGICGGLMGIIYLALSPFVWKGNRGGMITAIVFVVLTMLLILLNLVSALVQGGGAEAIIAVVMNLVFASIGGVLLFLLFRSLGALRAREQYAYTAAAHQAAAWQQQGYYGYQQPHSPQSPPPSQPQQGWGSDPNDPPPPQNPSQG